MSPVPVATVVPVPSAKVQVAVNALPEAEVLAEVAVTGVLVHASETSMTAVGGATTSTVPSHEEVQRPVVGGMAGAVMDKSKS